MPMPASHKRTWFHAVALSLICVTTSAASASAQDAGPSVPAASDPAVLIAEVMPKAAESIVLDVVRTLSGYVAVGERGHVLLSPNGVEWTQAAGVPTRATLNAVAAVGDSIWAGGHDGVILYSPDAGNTWQRQRIDVWSADGVEPSAGAPILDLLFLDKSHGFAVGAYSLLLETRDGGASWERRTLPPPPEQPQHAVTGEEHADPEAWTFNDEDLVLEAVADPHLNGIARTAAGELMIAAERGAVFRSRDDGASWERIALPYGGSMFGALAWDAGHVLMFGLQGRVFETRDLGDSWVEIDSGVRSSLMGGTTHPDGGAVLVGAQGTVLSRDRDDAALTHRTFVNANNETPILAGVLDHPEGGFVVYGERGVDRYRPQ